jgi:DNA-binding transcriptional ArsR family regulator
MAATTLSLNQIDLMFRAFSDRTRLRILYLLKYGETCVGDLVEILGVPQAKASRHLAYLRKAGLVEVRRDGLLPDGSGRKNSRHHWRRSTVSIRVGINGFGRSTIGGSWFFTI